MAQAFVIHLVASHISILSAHMKDLTPEADCGFSFALFLTTVEEVNCAGLLPVQFFLGLLSLELFHKILVLS